MSSRSGAAFFGSTLGVVGVMLLYQYLSPSISEETGNTRRKDSETIFKISLRPINFEEDQNPERDKGQTIERLVREAYNVENDAQIQVLSIANDSFLKARVGTLCFSKISSSIDQTRTNQRTLTNSEKLPNISLNISLDFNGLTPLYSGSIELQSLDIIAVPGLGGHAIGSFKAEKENYMWLRDDLPQDLPNSCIYTYGHLSKVPESTSFQSLFDLGASFKDILRNLVNHNKKEGHRKRIILIGHSLGGLIIKEAVCQLSRERIDDVLELLRGILFFGTPNEGMDNSNVVLMVRGQPNEDFVRSIGNDSAELRRLGEQWHDVFKGEASLNLFKNLEIFSYYETEKSPTCVEINGKWKREGPLATLVDRNSATHGRPFEDDNRHILPIARNHSNLVKFRTNDYIYSNHVKPTLEGLLEMRQKTDFFPLNDKEKACLRSLSFVEYDTRHDRIKKADNNTCTWLFEDPKYEKWSLQETGLLRLKGHRTSGKSTLMKVLFEKMESQPQVIVMRHFFWRGGVELQRNACGFLQSLMCQFLPSSFRSFNVAMCKYERMNDKPSWEPQWMKDFLEKEIPLSCKNHSNLRFVILIDALDECSPEDKGDVMDFLTNLLSAQEGPQICVSYALLPGQFPESLEIDIASKNGPDIARFVEKKLSILPLRIQALKTDIVRRAKGMFVWAKRACEKVIELHPEGKPVSAIQQAIESLPEELNGIYLETIREVKPGNVHETLRLFMWICFARWPLTVSELQDAIMMAPDMKETSIQNLRKSDNFRDRKEMMRAIHHLSMGFAETIELPIRPKNLLGPRRTMYFTSTDRTVVQLIHDSAYEFLLSTGFKEILKRDTSRICSDEEAKDVISSSSHFHLSRSCIRYLSMEERHKWTPLGVQYVKNISSFPLLEYAASSWLFHTKQVESAKKSQDDVLQMLRWPSSDIFDDWKKVRGVYDDDTVAGDLGRYNVTLLHVLAGYGIVSLLRTVLNNNEIGGGQKFVEHWRPHSQRVDNSQEGLIISTIEADRVDLQVPAAKLLLGLGANPNRQSRHGTPFGMAAGFGDEEMIKAFLELPAERARVSEEVLMAAACNLRNGPTVMRVLLDMRLPEIKITLRVVQRAFINHKSGDEVMRVVIEDKKLETDAFEGVLLAILTGFGEKTAESFLRLRCQAIEITEQERGIDEDSPARRENRLIPEHMMCVAARNELSGVEWIKAFLRARSLYLQQVKRERIFGVPLLGARHSWRDEMGVILLLNKENSSALYVRKLVIFTIRSKKGADLMQCVLEEPRFKIRITKAMIDQVNVNGAGAILMKLLLQKGVAEFRPLLTEDSKRRAGRSWLN